jgi:hypothetical protein
MSQELFESLRAQVFAQNPGIAAPIAELEDFVPIEQTAEGWFGLEPGGFVVHLDDRGKSRERVASQEQALALIGKLARQYPIATWFLPRPDRVMVCPDCGGTGILTNLPPELRMQIVCRCGGIGWLAMADGR